MTYDPLSEEGEIITTLRRQLALAEVQRDGYRLRLGEAERALIKIEARCNRLAIDNIRLGRELTRLQGNSEPHR